VFDVDWQGAASIASILPEDTVRVFILPPSGEELARRIHMRGTDAKEVIEKRMRGAAREISHWNEYDYVLANRDVGSCRETAERLSPKQPAFLAGRPNRE
jgi:guanylate kinase